MTKAEQIRTLASAGKTVKEIAAELNIRYQHVYNTIKKVNIEVKQQGTTDASKKEASKRSAVDASITELEEAILRGACFNEFNDCREGWATWTFTVIDNSGLDGKTASGVISSLVKKGLAHVSQEKGEEDMFGLTEAGIELTKEWTE